jgi:energy-coupling factor transporter ATP-binding protein EcfA2
MQMARFTPIETFNGFVDVVYQNPTSPFCVLTVSEEGK